jgi:pimeloyl-ACP methyl ester carboxylesterase
MLIRLASAIAVVLLLGSCSGSGPDLPDRMADVGTHRLHAVVTGDGTPAVVFDGGIAVRCEEYRVLQDRIARETTVVTYDRAGYGSSDGGPLPRDSGTEVDELRALLARLRIPGPYVLVGHSLGGLNVEVYANRYPDEVAGMVLLDPPPLGFLLGQDYAHFVPLVQRMTDEWQQIADRGLRSDVAQERAQGLFFQMLASEQREMLGRSAELAEGIETFGDIPLVVIASGVPNPAFGEEAAAYQHYWADRSRALAAKSSRGEFVLAERSTHRLHDEAADLVAESILSVLEQARGSE